MAAANAGRVSRAAAAASMRFCRAAVSHCACHAVQPRMSPWLQMRFTALCASCLTRSSLARSA